MRPMCRRHGGLWALALVQASQSSGRLFLGTDGGGDAPGTAGVPSRGRRVGAVLTRQARMRRASILPALCPRDQLRPGCFWRGATALLHQRILPAGCSRVTGLRTGYRRLEGLSLGLLLFRNIKTMRNKHWIYL